MRCSKARHYISLNLDGELSANHKPKLSSHLGSCAACRNWQTEAEKLHNMLSTTPKVEFPAWVHAQIMDKVHRLDERRPGLIRRYKLAPATAMLSIMLSIWAGAAVGIRTFTPAETETADSYTTVATTDYTEFGENSLMDSYYVTGDTNE